MPVTDETGQESVSPKKRIRRKKVKIILRSGLRSTPLAPEDLDGRFGITQDYRARLNSLVEAMGDEPSPQEYSLIKRIAWADTILDNHEIAVMGGYVPTESERKWYIGLRNSNSRDIGRLGIARRMKNITPLREQLAALEAEQENEHGEEEAETQTSETGQAG